jgi:hypothetical protein
MKYAVVTTFNQQGYELYAQRMIQTFLENWPVEVELLVFSENCQVHELAPNLRVFDLEAASPELVGFKNRWRNVPKANGDISQDPVRGQRKDSAKGFKWDAVRFSHKVYAVFAAAKQTNADFLIWMDADMVCHSKMSLDFLHEKFAGDLCFLGRQGKYTECGLYGINLKSTLGQQFLNRFQEVYDQDLIFNFSEWHDSFVFDEVRRGVQCVENDWSSNIISGEGHPLINTDWGAYLDHLKGNRKQLGRSKPKDLKIQRSETYWRM